MFQYGLNTTCVITSLNSGVGHSGLPDDDAHRKHRMVALDDLQHVRGIST